VIHQYSENAEGVAALDCSRNALSQERGGTRVVVDRIYPISDVLHQAVRADSPQTPVVSMANGKKSTHVTEKVVS